MAIEVAAWNVLNGLGDQSRSAQVIETVKQLDADIVILPEACEEAQTLEVAGDVQAKLGAEYVVTPAPYDDGDDRLDRHGMLVLNRLAADSPQGDVRLGSRNGILLEVSDPDTDIRVRGLGVHYDDRSPQQRMRQAMHALDVLDAPSAHPKFIGGDFNSMPRRLLRAGLGRLAMLAPAHYPTAERREISRTERGLNVVHRVGTMANDHALELFTAAGFDDSDAWSRYTWGPRHMRIAQLDHIMVGGEARATGFQLHAKNNLSDHAPISATIET